MHNMFNWLTLFQIKFIFNNIIYMKMFENTNKVQNILNKVKQDKTIVDVKMNISA